MAYEARRARRAREKKRNKINKTLGSILLFKKEGKKKLMENQSIVTLLHQLGYLDERSLINFCQTHSSQCESRSIQKLLEQRIFRLMQEDKNWKRVKQLCQTSTFNDVCQDEDIQKYINNHYLYDQKGSSKQQERGRQFLEWLNTSPSRKKILLKYIKNLCGGSQPETLLAQAKPDFQKKMGSLVLDQRGPFDIRGFLASEGPQSILYDLCP